ncbi:hypothetical protein Gotur_025081 [Gossypium turneri]
MRCCSLLEAELWLILDE